jgi:hypothetical protein
MPQEKSKSCRIFKEKYIAGPKDSIKPFAIHNTGDGCVTECCILGL